LTPINLNPPTGTRRSGVAENAIETLRCAEEEGQRTEGRRIEVSAGLDWSVVEGCTAERK
jgi:hypothetical protein